MSLEKERSAEGVMTLVLSHEPVNAVATPLRKALLSALIEAEHDGSVRAVVIAGNDAIFSAGADLVEFSQGRGFDYPSFHATVLPFMHEMKKPIVAAITGRAIGGGLELALWCHARVASPEAPLGLPETSLGLMPGAGGTQLLPRAVGLERAVGLIVAGKVLPAGAFKDTRLINEYASRDQVVVAARRLAIQIANEGRPYPHLSKLKVKHPQPQGFLKFAKSQARASRGFLPSMITAIDAIELSMKLPAIEGLHAEFEMFRPLVGSPDARAIRHAFFAERSASKVNDLPAKTKVGNIQWAGVIGAGFMGSGIAHCLARAGIGVRVFDVQEGAAARAVKALKEVPELSKANLCAVASLNELSDVDLVIEAIVEDLKAKQDTFRALDKVIRSGAILASNTSTLDVDAIAASTSRPQDVIGLHFFGPAPVMRLLEVVRAAKTAHGVLASALELAKRLRKVPVVSRVGPGFIANRIYHKFMDQALTLAATGIRPWHIDTALERWGWRMGPFRTMDLIGNDVLVRARAVGAQLSVGDRLMDRLVESGRLGQKAGKGWYDYEAKSRHSQPSSEVESILLGSQSPMNASAIVDRCMLAMINEAAAVLEEGIAQRASDIDLSFLLGYGFPRLKGGPMFYAEEMGLPVIVQKLQTLQRETSDVTWKPALLLIKTAQNDGQFSKA